MVTQTRRATTTSTEGQRVASLLAESLGDVAAEVGITESDARNILSRLLQAGLLQERKAPEARRQLAQVLEPSLTEIDPVPRATVDQARRLAELRASLLRRGALTTSALAEARGITPNNARQWISRHRRAHRIFTVTHEGETLVPAFLLDDAFEPNPSAAAAIAPLRAAGEDGWALWTWFASPSAWLGGRVPSEVLTIDPEAVAVAAKRRAAAAA